MLAPPFLVSVTLGKLVNPLKLCFLICKMGKLWYLLNRIDVKIKKTTQIKCLAHKTLST